MAFPSVSSALDFQMKGSPPRIYFLVKFEGEGEKERKSVAQISTANFDESFFERTTSSVFARPWNIVRGY